MSKVYELRFEDGTLSGTYESEEEAIEEMRARVDGDKFARLSIGEHGDADKPNCVRLISLMKFDVNMEFIDEWFYGIYEVEKGENEMSDVATNNTKENEAMSETINVMSNEAVTEQKVKERMVEDVKDLLSEYEYCFNHYHIKEIVEEWYEAKTPLRNILRNYPQWDEMAQAVVLKGKSILRAFDKDGAFAFRDWMKSELAKKNMWEVRDYVDGMFSYIKAGFDNELGNLINFPELEKITPIKFFMANESFKDIPKPVNGQKWSRYFGALCKKYGLNTITDVRTELHTDPATGELVKREKDYGYNYYMALLGDSINPLEIPGKDFLLSLNIIDFLTMSFGNNWASCHTIDKENRRRSEHTYEGQYSGGTLDYALDDVTMIAYFVDDENENKHGRNNYHHYGSDVPYCRRDKEHRAVVAWQNDKIYTARVYPDGRDGGEVGIGAQFREIIQQIFAQSLGVSNIWTTKKGAQTTEQYVESDDYIAAYPDWQHCPDGAISFLRRIDGILNEQPIKICAGAICPNCGTRHAYSDNILCEECAGDVYGHCEHCGDAYNEDNEVWVGDGYDVGFCCYDCAAAAGYYRDHYMNWIHIDDAIRCVDNDEYYPEDDDSVVYCEDDDNNHLRENCHQCSADGKWYSPEVDGITTYDGEWFHDEDAASDNGYVLCDDDNKWHHFAA